MIVTVGDVVADLVCWLDQPWRRGTDAFASIAQQRGGSAANVAGFVASLGAEAGFVGAIGDDDVGEQLRRSLERSGVAPFLEVRPAESSGTVVVVVEPGGERTMLSSRGAAANLAAPPPEWFNACSWLHVPFYGFAAEPMAGTLIAMAEALGGRCSVDLSSVALLDVLGPSTVLDRLREMRPAIVFANGEEGEWAASNLPAGWAQGHTLVIKNGPDPVEITLPDGTRTRHPVKPVTGVLDTTGAGDAFAAAYLVCHVRGASVADCVNAGSELAGQVITARGAARSL